MDVEVRFLTEAAVDPAPFLTRRSLPAGPYATLVYQGNRLPGTQALLSWTKSRGIVLDHLDPSDPESFVARYEAYRTDVRQEPRKLLWDVELAIKVAD